MADGEELEGRGLVAHSYSTFFKIRKRMRKLQDITLPFRRGIGVEQFLTFLLVVFLSLVLYGTLLSPLFALIGISPNWQFYLLYFFGPAALAGSRVGKPMKSGKTISGTVRSYTRKLLDDPVHRRGVPMRSRPVVGWRMHYMRAWQPDPALAQHLPPGATGIVPAASGTPVDLEEWLATAAKEMKVETPEPVSDEDQWRRRVRGNTDRVVLPSEYEHEENVR
jgi:hypothetical protein